MRKLSENISIGFLFRRSKLSYVLLKIDDKLNSILIKEDFEFDTEQIDIQGFDQDN